MSFENGWADSGWDESIPGAGEAEGWEAEPWEADFEAAYGANEYPEADGADPAGFNPQEFAQEILTEYDQARVDQLRAYTQEQAEAQYDAQYEAFLEQERDGIEATIGREINPSEWKLLEHVHATDPNAQDLRAAFAQVQGMTRQEKIDILTARQNEERMPDTLEYKAREDWSNDPEQRRADRLEYARALQAYRDGTYYDPAD